MSCVPQCICETRKNKLLFFNIFFNQICANAPRFSNRDNMGHNLRRSGKNRCEQIEVHLLEAGQNWKTGVSPALRISDLLSFMMADVKGSMLRKLNSAQIMGIVDSLNLARTRQGTRKRSYKNRERTHGISSISRYRE